MGFLTVGEGLECDHLPLYNIKWGKEGKRWQNRCLSDTKAPVRLFSNFTAPRLPSV